MLPYTNQSFSYLSSAIGASEDELKLLTTFLLSYPLCAVLKRLPDDKPWLKNVFIIAVALFYMIGLFDLWDGIRTLLYSSVITYAIAYYIDGSLMPWIGFIFLMGHMSVNHIDRQLTNDASRVDITGAQMVLIMKLSAFCWNVYDGRELKEEQMNDYQKDRAIRVMPGFLEYAGYVLFFPALFIGPAFDFNDYKRWLNSSLYAAPAGVPVAPIGKKRKLPRSGTAAAWKAVYGLAWICAFLKCSTWYNQELLLGDEFMQYSLLRRIWILNAVGFTTRQKYYGVWSLTEGACILSGIGYNGIDPRTGKARWDRLENVYPWGIEAAQNSRAYLENWNKNTNNWLRNYIYLRVTPRGKKPGFRASLATFTTSAFWHGFYPGYYLTFVLGAFIQTVAKNFRRYFRPFFMTPDGQKPTRNKTYYNIVSYLATQAAFCFTVAPFYLLSFSDSIKVWSRVYFYCPIGVALSMAFFASPAKSYLIKKLNTRNHPRVHRTIHEETRYGPTLGLPNDPGRDVDEAIEEIKMEVENRRRRGSRVSMPSGQELKSQVEGKLGRKLK